MEIVINIPDKLYNFAKNGHFFDAYDMYDVSMCIAKGTPLPKGHGDLVDRNDLKYEKFNSYAYAIANAPTIIEADKESRNDTHNNIDCAEQSSFGLQS